MIKKLIILFSIIFGTINCSYAYYDMSVPVEGGTIANEELQFEVIHKLYKTLSPVNPKCSDFKISNTQLLHYPYDAKKDRKGNYIKGYWKELWSVDICGNIIQLPVTFYIKRRHTEFETEKFLLNK